MRCSDQASAELNMTILIMNVDVRQDNKVVYSGPIWQDSKGCHWINKDGKRRVELLNRHWQIIN